MKMKNILYLLLVLLCMPGCSDELIDGSGRPVLAGDSVQVTLSFNRLSFESPFSAGTRSAAGRILSVSADGVEAELVEVPVSLTRSAEDDRVYGFWVLQFNGTAATSSLTRKQYYNCPSGTLSSTAVTLNSGEVRQRIVVIANAGSSHTNSVSPVKGLTVSTSTYGDLLNLHYTFGTAQPDYPLYKDKYPDATGGGATEHTLPVMCGIADGVVSEGMPALYISLRRSVSKITILDVGLDASLKTDDYPLWQASLVNLPASSYLLPLGRGSFFPGPDGGYTGHRWPETPAEKSYQIPRKEFYVPVNLLPPVAGTTLPGRHAKAPSGATYVQVMGYKIEYNKFDTDKEVPIIKRSVIFQIHLGTNFTDNFSIPPNHDLMYKISLKAPASGEGSAGETRFVPGYFGGVLVGIDKNGAVLDYPNNPAAVEWRFGKKLEVYPQNNRCLMKVQAGVGDDSYFGSDTMRWLRNGTTLASSIRDECKNFMNGFGGTVKVAGNVLNGPACTLLGSLGYRLENQSNASASVVYQSDWWYAPAIGQLLGIWIAGSGLISTMGGISGFWSSTIDNTGTRAYLLTLDGEVRESELGADRYHARAVRNID